MLSCPSHSAITERSTPACKRSIAMVWRYRWTVTRLSFNDGHAFEAVMRCLFNRYCTPSTLSRLPFALGKSTSSVPRGGSCSQLFNTARVGFAGHDRSSQRLSRRCMASPINSERLPDTIAYRQYAQVPGRRIKPAGDARDPGRARYQFTRVFVCVSIMSKRRVGGA